MRARAFRPGQDAVERALGSILAADARGRDGHIVLRKGTLLGEEHHAVLLGLAGSELHLVDLDDGELPQEEVARRLAHALAGPGTLVDAPQQGQSRLRAAWRGLLRVDGASIRRLNALPGVLCFTLPDAQVVLEGDEVAGVKGASLATPERVVATAEAIAREAGPVLSVAAFARRSVAVVVTERLEARGRALVAEAVRRKVEWYGSALVGVSEVAHAVEPVARQLRADRERGALILVSGANALDPLDPVLVATASLGGAVLRTGVPAHPGSMVWVASLGSATVLGVATCAGFGRNTSLDLVLPRVLAGEDPARAVDELGYGGLVEGPRAAWRFPPYERGRAARALEEATAS